MVVVALVVVDSPLLLECAAVVTSHRRTVVFKDRLAGRKNRTLNRTTSLEEEEDVVEDEM